jgi:CRISPR-associated protein Cmr3
MSRIGLCLEPLDVLFFRDGRPFDAASKVKSGLPTPQVLAGAVRTALLEKNGCDFGALRRYFLAPGEKKSFAEGLPERLRWIAGVKFRGPWLCSLPTGDVKTAADVFLPAPATVHTRKKGERVEGQSNVFLPHVLKEPPPGWKESLRPLWLSPTDSDPERGRTPVTTEPAGGFINTRGLTQFLAGQCPDENTLLGAGAFYDFDNRTGIGVDGGTLTAGDGEIYGIRFLALKQRVRITATHLPEDERPRSDVGFYAEIDLPGELGKEAFAGIDVLAFGGEGKRVAVSVVPPFPFPEPPKCEGKQKRLLLLTTPAVTSADGHPYLPENCVAAAVNAPVAISGWDIAKGGPKPTRFASPAGSVYFLDSTADVPDAPDEFGYGCHLQGVWTDE